MSLNLMHPTISCAVGNLLFATRAHWFALHAPCIMIKLKRQKDVN